jgi:hypothetical protein
VAVSALSKAFEAIRLQIDFINYIRGRRKINSETGKTEDDLENQ